MFLVRWIRKILSLPLLWLGQLLAMFKQPISVAPLKAAWFISGNGDVGRIALSAVYQHAGPEVALAQAKVWLAGCPRPEIAAVAGIMAVNIGKINEAARLLARGRELGETRDGMLEMLEHAVMENIGSPAENIALARRFELRCDLPPAISKTVRIRLLWDDMLNQRFDDAQRRAEFLLEVEDVPQAEMALWALAKHRADEPKAQMHLERAKFPEALKVYYRFLGSFATGSIDEARRLLEPLRELDTSMAQQAEDMLNEKEWA